MFCTRSIQHTIDTFISGQPAMSDWQGHCPACAKKHNLERVFTVWSLSGPKIIEYRLGMMYHNRYYLVCCHLYGHNGEYTTVYGNMGETGYHLAYQTQGLIFSPNNALTRLKTVLTFS